VVEIGKIGVGRGHVCFSVEWKEVRGELGYSTEAGDAADDLDLLSSGSRGGSLEGSRGAPPY
jgi:hypothetical protein